MDEAYVGFGKEDNAGIEFLHRQLGGRVPETPHCIVVGFSHYQLHVKSRPFTRA